MSKFHVSQIETHLRHLYGPEHWNSTWDDTKNLSRLLGLYALELSLGPSAQSTQRITEITDGGADHGIDAVGIDKTAKLVLLVQSKWRKDGSGSMQLADMLKFLNGVESLLGMKNSGEPSHASLATRSEVSALLATPGARIGLLTVTTASDPLSEDVRAPVAQLLSKLNDLEGTDPLAAHKHLAQAELFNSLATTTRPSIDLTLQISDWGRATDPHKLYYGRVNAAELASWYQVHGDNLFADNIRVVIPRSEINEGIADTIRESPAQFGYFNNGITILAREIKLSPSGQYSREGGQFELKGASIVNGAQTVSTLGRTLGTEHEHNLSDAFVIVKCVEVPELDDALGRNITRYTNTQNEVSSQDFAFLDSEQHRLAKELSVLGYEYLLRSAERPNSKDSTKVIESREAAVALACASSNASHAVVAKREVSRLFSDPALYKALFNPQTDPLRVLRAVLIVRSVDCALDEVESAEDGVIAGIAVHGRRVIAHELMRRLGDNFLRDPQAEMADVLTTIRVDAVTLANELAAVFPDNSYPGNVFKNQARVTELVSAAETVRATPAGPGDST